MLKASLSSLIIIFLCTSCTVVPVKKAHSDNDIKCGVSTHEYDLKMIKSGHITASCNSPECILSIGVFAAAWTGVTAIISGSIVIIGNTVHWLEQQGPCDSGELDEQVFEINNPLIQQGGKSIVTKEALERELEND